jgi:hypothetical protein
MEQLAAELQSLSAWLCFDYECCLTVSHDTHGSLLHNTPWTWLWPSHRRAHLQQLPLNGTRTVVAQDIKLHVYDKGDAVTDYIIEKSTWEEHVMAQLTWAMQQFDTQKVGCS